MFVLVFGGFFASVALSICARVCALCVCVCVCVLSRRVAGLSAAGLRCTASDKCQQEKRKTINGDDLLWAMATLGFDRYIEPLKVYLAKYREVRATAVVRCHRGALTQPRACRADTRFRDVLVRA